VCCARPTRHRFCRKPRLTQLCLFWVKPGFPPLGAARPLPPSADIGPGAQSIYCQAAQFCLGSRVAFPVTATTDSLAPDILCKCRRAVRALTHALHRTLNALRAVLRHRESSRASTSTTLPRRGRRAVGDIRSGAARRADWSRRRNPPIGPSGAAIIRSLRCRRQRDETNIHHPPEQTNDDDSACGAGLHMMRWF